VRRPCDLSSSETTGPTEAIGVALSASRNRSSQWCACATSIRRRTWPELVSAMASMRRSAISSIAVNDVGIGGFRVVDVRKHGIDLGALRRDGADQRAVILVGIKLQAEAMSRELEARQHLDDAFGGRLLRRRLRLQSDLAQRPAGFRAAGEFPRLSDRGNELPARRLSAAPTFISRRRPSPVISTRSSKGEAMKRRIQASTGAGSGASWMVNIGHCSTSAPCSASSRENCASSRVSRIRMR